MMSFFNDSDPCKLICASPGKHPVEESLVVDATSCLTGGWRLCGKYNISELLHKEERLCTFHLI